MYHIVEITHFPWVIDLPVTLNYVFSSSLSGLGETFQGKAPGAKPVMPTSSQHCNLVRTENFHSVQLEAGGSAYSSSLSLSGRRSMFIGGLPFLCHSFSKRRMPYYGDLRLHLMQSTFMSVRFNGVYICYVRSSLLMILCRFPFLHLPNLT